MLEQTARDERKTSRLGQKRQLKILSENLGSDSHGKLLAIERSFQRCATSTSRRIEKPVFFGQIPQAPRAAVPFCGEPRRRNHDDLFRSERNTLQPGWDRVGVGQQSDGAIDGATPHFFDEADAPIRTDLEPEAGKILPKRFQRRAENYLSQAVGHPDLQFASWIGGARRAGFQFRHGSKHAPAMFEHMAAKRRQYGGLHRAIEKKAFSHGDFEALDAPRHGRLGEIEARCRAAHGARFRHCHEGLDILKIHAPDL
nr:hypothetical protein [Neorhizobium tomejilense]